VAEGRIRIGDVELLALRDVEWIDWPHALGTVFPDVPPEAWEPYRRRYPSVFGGGDVWRLPIVCFLVRDGRRQVLVDTGCGPGSLPLPRRLGVEGRLVERLAAAGVRPADIDTVLLTHLHPDHVGAALAHGDGELRPTFPRARYLVHRAEWEAWSRPEVRDAFPTQFFEQLVAPLERLGALQLIEDEHPIAPAITAIHTPGHTPGSVSALISSAGARAIVWGDAFVHPASVSEPGWRFLRDMDPEGAVATRRRLLERVVGEGMTVAAAHLPECGLGRVDVLDGRRVWTALEVGPPARPRA
jgi:glyoxylase-like metal-dependent hydrolase (beta-lactamase superfamily II)